MASHSLHRAYATAATNASVDEDTVGKLLKHGGRSVTARYYNYGAPGADDERVWSETGCTCVLVTSTNDVLRSLKW